MFSGSTFSAILLIALSALTLTLAFVYFILLIFMRRGWQRLPLGNNLPQGQLPTVAIIVAARNEEANIAETIDCLLKQDYPRGHVEIIVINDHSTDNTAEIAGAYAAQGVRLINLNESARLNSYKKKAIQTAIMQCNARLVITTDADCRMGTRWLSIMVGKWCEGKHKMLSGPVFYDREKSFFEKLQSVEFLYLIGLGAAAIGNNDAATCNGANLLYERDTFLAVGGFAGIDTLASGDDELLLHKIHAKYPGSVGFVKSRDAVVYTDAKPNLKEFIAQRKRWASKSTHYKNRYVVAMGVGIWAFNVLLVVNLLMTVVHPVWLLVFAAQLLIKEVAELVFVAPICRFAGRQGLLPLIIILSPIHALYLAYIGLAANNSTYSWKGRIVR